MAPLGSGQYKGKTTNLSAKQLKTAVSSAGGKKVGTYKKNLGAATATDIGKTSWVKGKGLVNSASPGTRITGTVTLGTGEKATYVNGRRLRAADAAKPSSNSGGGGGGGKAAPKTDSRNAPGSNRSSSANVGMTAREKSNRAAAAGRKPLAAGVNRSGMVSVGNELTGASNYGKRMNTQYSQDRLTPKKPGAAPKPSTRPKVAMPTGKQVSKATGGVMGMSAAGTPIRKQMPAGAQTDLVKLGAKVLLTPGVGLAAGAIKGGTTAGRLVAGKLAGSAAGKAAGRGAVTAGTKVAGKVAGSKTAGKVAGSAAGKAAGKKIAAKKLVNKAAADKQWVANSNAASRAASRADSIARTKAALGRATAATNKKTRASALAAARREKATYGKGR